MSDEPIGRPPRRDLLRAASGAAALLGCGSAATPAAASAKMPHKLVHYQATPNGAARCQGCTQFLPSPACKLVDDPITPSGWCVLYAKAG